MSCYLKCVTCRDFSKCGHTPDMILCFHLCTFICLQVKLCSVPSKKFEFECNSEGLSLQLFFFIVCRLLTLFPFWVLTRILLTVDLELFEFVKTDIIHARGLSSVSGTAVGRSLRLMVIKVDETVIPETTTLCQ